MKNIVYERCRLASAGVKNDNETQNKREEKPQQSVVSGKVKRKQNKYMKLIKCISCFLRLFFARRISRG